jgi:molybdopterin-containing oxidoreductase family membrane subunit
VLFLFRSHFRRAVYRVAEAMTVFGVMTAGLFPLLHAGRPWFAYWLVPYPNQRQLWPNFRSPLEWDVFRGHHLPDDLDRVLPGRADPRLRGGPRPGEAPDAEAAVHALLVRWTGTNNQWKHFYGAYIFFAAMATPLVFSVHSVVSWDFAMAQIPGWHSTLFAPYFVAGAIFSGVALVINLLIPIRIGFKLEHIVTLDHIEKLAKLVLLTSTIVGYSYLSSSSARGTGPASRARPVLVARTGHFWWAFWIMFTCNVIIPLLLWFKQVRRNMGCCSCSALFVNVGMCSSAS